MGPRWDGRLGIDGVGPYGATMGRAHGATMGWEAWGPLVPHWVGPYRATMGLDMGLLIVGPTPPPLLPSWVSRASETCSPDPPVGAVPPPNSHGRFDGGLVCLAVATKRPKSISWPSPETYAEELRSFGIARCSNQ